MINTSLVTYNGMALPLPQVSFSARAEYDSTGNVLQGHFITFRGRCVLASSDGTVATFNSQLATFEQNFCLARKRFTWSSGGTIQFDIFPGDTQTGPSSGASVYVDRRYGPKPRIVAVRQIPGGLSAIIEWEIECFIYACLGSLLDVEEFWWSFSYSFDRNFNCTRNVTGRYRVRSPLSAATQFLPNGAYFPALPSNFYRENFQHRLSPDGLVLDFSFTDRQVWRTLPQPLTGGSATMRVTAGIAGQLRKNLSGSFEAPTDTDKKVILQFVVALVQAKFPDAISGQTPGSTTLLEWFTQFEFNDHVFENRVDFSVSSQRSAIDFTATNSPTVNNIISSIFGDVANVTPAQGDSWKQVNGQSQNKSVLGTAGLLPQASPPYNLCGGSAATTGPTSEINQQLSVPPGTQSDNPPGSGQGGGGTYSGSPPGSFSIANPVVGPGFRDSSVASNDFKFPYVSFSESYHFILDRCLVVLAVPIADPPGGNPVPDIVQQVAKPQLRIVQIGTARRIGIAPDRPMPLYVDNGYNGQTGAQAGAYVAKEEVRTREPRLMPDGRTLEYGLSWSYQVISTVNRTLNLAGGKTATETSVRVPVNPMLSPSLYGGTGAQKYIINAPSSDGSESPQANPVSTDGGYGGNQTNTWDSQYYPNG